MPVLLLLIGIIWILLGLATSVPPLAVAGGAYVLGAWVAHATRGMARGSFLRATAATVFVTFGSLVAVAVAYLLWTGATARAGRILRPTFHAALEPRRSAALRTVHARRAAGRPGLAHSVYDDT